MLSLGRSDLGDPEPQTVSSERTISHSTLFHIAGDFSKPHGASFPPKFLGLGCELGESALPNHK